MVGCSKEGSREGLREGLAWRSGGGARASVPGGVGGRLFQKGASQGRGQGLAVGGGARASVPGGGTGPRDGANFATCVVFLSKKKNGVF